MKQQVNHIKCWADIVSIHPISGFISIESIDNIDMILIAEMSSEGHLMSDSYKTSVVKMAEKEF